MIRNFTILLFVLLFSFSFMYAKDKKINKKPHQEKRSSYTTLKTFHEPAEAVYNNDNNVSSNSSSINKGQLITKTSNGYTHVLIDSSRNGYGWLNTSIRSIDRFCGIDAFDQDVDFLLLGYRQYITSSPATGIIGATTIDVANGLNGALTYRHVELNQVLLSEGTIGGRYPGVVALERPFIAFNQYISGDANTTPAISSPYLKTEYGSYGVYGGAFTPSRKMDQGYTHHDSPDGNRLWNGPVSIVKDAGEVYHYAAVYANWYLDSEIAGNPNLVKNDYAIMNASSSDPTSGWTIATDPVLIDPSVFTFVSPAIDMNSSGFGVVASTGHAGFHEGNSYMYEELRIVFQTTTDYGATWSDAREVSWAELGIPTQITADDSLFYWDIQGPDTVLVQYIGRAFVGTNFDMDVIVSEDNNIYVGWNCLWGRPGDSGWYPDYRGSGVYVAVSNDAGASFEARRIAINNGFFEGDSIIPGMPSTFFESEIDLAMDETGNLYAAWLDRPDSVVELAEKPRYGTGDLEYKTDVFAARSLNGGVNWGERINVTNSVSLDEYEFKLAKSAASKNNGTIYAAYCLVDPNSEPFQGGDDNYTDRVNRIWVSEAYDFPEDTTVAIEDDIKTQTLKSFALKQNYPNPFNPGTKIEFVPIKSGQAKLDVYSISGEKVAQLYNGYAKAGKKYAFDFDGSRLASGIYFYRLKIGTKVEVKKMALIK